MTRECHSLARTEMGVSLKLATFVTQGCQVLVTEKCKTLFEERKNFGLDYVIYKLL